MTAAALVGGFIVVLSAVPAAACEGRNCGDDNDGGADPEASRGTVGITVWGSGTTNGDTGSFEVPLEEVWIHPTCWYVPGPTGAEYAEYVESGQINWERQHFDEQIPELPGWEEYADDDDGQWWYRVCSSAYHDGEISEFFEFVDEWLDNNPPIYLDPGDPEPVTSIPPEVLMEVAYDAMDIPDPQLAWNPSRDVDAATFVNMDTWVWLEDSPVTLEVHAAAGGNEATVTAALTSMTVDAPSAKPVTCDNTGVPWSSTLAAGCEIIFTRSSANMPDNVTPVTVETTWTVAWSANGTPQGSLDPQEITTVEEVPVAEIQAVVSN